jgi:hypothetical protein
MKKKKILKFYQVYKKKERNFERNISQKKIDTVINLLHI